MHREIIIILPPPGSWLQIVDCHNFRIPGKKHFFHARLLNASHHNIFFRSDFTHFIKIHWLLLLYHYRAVSCILMYISLVRNKKNSASMLILNKSQSRWTNIVSKIANMPCRLSRLYKTLLWIYKMQCDIAIGVVRCPYCNPLCQHS